MIIRIFAYQAFKQVVTTLVIVGVGLKYFVLKRINVKIEELYLTLTTLFALQHTNSRITFYNQGFSMFTWISGWAKKIHIYYVQGVSVLPLFLKKEKGSSESREQYKHYDAGLDNMFCQKLVSGENSIREVRKGRSWSNHLGRKSFFISFQWRSHKSQNVKYPNPTECII